MLERLLVLRYLFVVLSVFLSFCCGCDSLWRKSEKHNKRATHDQLAAKANAESSAVETETEIKVNHESSKSNQFGKSKPGLIDQTRSRNADFLKENSTCEALARTRLGVYRGSVATPGDSGAIYSRSGASLDQLFQNGVQILPKFAKLNGAPLPLSYQPGHELLACYVSMSEWYNFRDAMRFTVIIGAAIDDAIATEPLIASPLIKNRFESCLRNAARQLIDKESDRASVKISGRFRPSDPSHLIVPKVANSYHGLELVARASDKTVSRGANVVLEVFAKNRSKSPIEYIRANCERASLLEFSVPGLLYGGRISSCSRHWERKVTIQPGRKISDSIRIKVDPSAEPGIRQFQVFRRVDQNLEPSIVCSNSISIQIQP